VKGAFGALVPGVKRGGNRRFPAPHRHQFAPRKAAAFTVARAHPPAAASRPKKGFFAMRLLFSTTALGAIAAAFAAPAAAQTVITTATT
jgi:hypothetical protein